MAIAKNMSSTIQIIDHRLTCANVHHDMRDSNHPKIIKST